MKMVSAAKLKKASDAILQMRPYTLKLQEMLGNVMGSLSEGENIPNLHFAEQRDIKKVLIVLITSDRGLAGAFNSNLIKKANELLTTSYAEQVAAGNVTVMTLGKKGFDAFKKESLTVDNTNNTIFHGLSFETSSAVVENIFSAFKAGEYDAVDVVFGEFKNAATQYIKAERFLPINMEFVADKGEVKETSKYGADYLFEPNKQELLGVLIPKILKTQFFRYLLDNNAS
ncbi:UNVERIFIED_CONTAM: hypothetical protein GTU68_066982, partial [Idotea baltica]|nr:hypothetical protein [Idotea baltica]